jgi:uncharacterized protein (UPF0332 family)
MSRLSVDLLKQAKDLARQDPKRPKDASIRRAISTAYYSFFHFLLDEATGLLVGEGPNDEAMRHLLSRCFVHGHMASACTKIIGLVTDPKSASSVYTPFTQSIKSEAKDLLVVAKTFKELQEHRHRADYDLGQRYPRSQALRSVSDVEDAMRAWNRIKMADRRLVQLVAVMLLHSAEIQKRHT